MDSESDTEEFYDAPEEVSSSPARQVEFYVVPCIHCSVVFFLCQLTMMFIIQNAELPWRDPCWRSFYSINNWFPGYGVG